MDTSSQSDAPGGEPQARRLRTLDEKLSILAQAAQPGTSVAAVARQHGLNANLLFAWRRLHRRGLLEAQRRVPALLPVTVTSPTVTPTRGARAVLADSARSRGAKLAPRSCETFIEIVIAGDTRIRLHGEAQRLVLARVLQWLPSR